MSGLIHMYCGEGKGKTTAALGLSIRAVGSGMKVVIARFMKDSSSAELDTLEKIKEIEVMPVEKDFGFYNCMTVQEREEATQVYTKLLTETIERVSSENYQMLILDEITAAYNHNFIDGDELVRFLIEKPIDLEVVMTGRDPSMKLIEISDYVSHIEEIKHPYNDGIEARKGIEF